jgi:thioredoxin 1
MSEIIATDANFVKEVIEIKGKPVLVDFWAVWCGPCKMQAPIIDEVAKEIGEQAKVVKVEVDESPNTAGKYNVLSIPTLVIFKDSEMVWQGVGVHQKKVLIDELKKHI